MPSISISNIGNFPVTIQTGISRVVEVAKFIIANSQSLAWADRVVANGGNYPSDQTLFILSNFYDGLVSANLVSKMKAVNCYVPDDMVSAITPLIVGVGNDPWTNFRFTASTDLNINGLAGGTNEYLNTGVQSADFTTSSMGVTIYVHTASAGGTFEIGDAPDSGDGAWQINISSSNGTYEYEIFDWPLGAATAGRITNVNNPNAAGYWCITRQAINDLRSYHANSSVPHDLFASTNASVVNNYLTTRDIYVHARHYTSTVDSFSPNRISFVAFHDNLNISESADFYNLIQSMRQSFGGGFV